MKIKEKIKQSIKQVLPWYKYQLTIPYSLAVAMVTGLADTDGRLEATLENSGGSDSCSGPLLYSRG